jgi:predicted small metal-binding protein
MKCNRQPRAETREELSKFAAEQAEKDHGTHVASLPRSRMVMGKGAIRDE